MPPIITGPVGMDPMLGEMRTIDIRGGSASGDYTFNSAEFTVGIAGLVSLNRVPSSKLDTVMDIVNVSGSSVTLEPNTAYKIYATSQAITLNANPPAAGKWAYEGHLEIFTAGTGYVVTGSNVVLANALEPDAVNNCTVRFHDGLAIISVEDHVAGYIVVSATGTTSGTLPYGIDTATQEYVAFDATLNGSTIDLSGSTANGEKHIVGNGYSETTLTGEVDCGTSKFTVANLTLQNVGVTGGTMTLGDAFIPSGSTVAVGASIPATAAPLRAEKVTGSGTINVNGDHSVVAVGFIGGVQITGYNGNHQTGYGAVRVASNGATISGCTFSNNIGNTFGCCIAHNGDSMECSVVSCTFRDNANNQVYGYRTKYIISGCVFEDTSSNIRLYTTSASAKFIGSNMFAGRVSDAGSVTLTSGAIIDLTGNTNATPIAPGGGITFESGGATVIVNGGTEATSSSYMMDNVTLPAGAKLTNTAVVDLGGTNVIVSSGTTASASGCTFAGGYIYSDTGAGIRVQSDAKLRMESCTVSSSFASSGNGGGIGILKGGSAELVSVNILNNSATYTGGGFFCAGNTELTNCTIKDNDSIRGQIYITSGATATIQGGCDIEDIWLDSDGVAALNGSNTIELIRARDAGRFGTVTISSGAIIDLTGNTNATPIAPGGGVIVDGGCQVITSAGTTVSIAGGTYTKINNDGTTE